MDTITIKSAVRLSEGQIKQIKANLLKKINIDAPVENIIEPSLLGGFTVEVRDWFLDASIENQMEFIKGLYLNKYK